MFTEILGVIIIVGVLLILLLRHNINNKNLNDAGAENVSVAAQQLKKELENTGDRISRQINEQMDHLETMINIADKKMEELRHYYAVLAEEENKTSLQIKNSPKTTERGNFDSLLQSAENNYREIGNGTTADGYVYTGEKIRPGNDIAKQALPAKVKQVFAMLDEGASSAEISRKLSIGRGGVEMIAQMYEKISKK